MVGTAQRDTLGLGVDIPENSFDDHYDSGTSGGGGTFECDLASPEYDRLVCPTRDHLDSIGILAG